ncbi:MAG: non-ribosomal peptide synthetase, partial [Acidobacteria bacterium]
RVREACLGAYQHQEVPFEKLVEELAPGRSLSHAPLYQVAFIFVNTQEAYSFDGLETSLFQIDPGTAKVDLTLAVTDTPERLNCILEYNTDLFDASTAERLSTHFVTLLGEVAADMDKPVRDLRLLTEGERRRVLQDFNDTSRTYPRDICIHQLFERQARVVPNSIALESEGEQLTYAELDARANRLARRLRRLGVGSESRVAVMLKRSPGLVVTLLAVLKAGGAYVPLDPEYPHERLRFMLEDSSARVLVTDSALAGLAEGMGVRAVCLDTAAEELSRESDKDLGARVSPDNLAYVMYTSGSTGQPKGVAVTHRNVVRLVLGQTYVEFGPGEVFLLLAPVCFDASTFELWGALLHGARLALMGAETPSLDDLSQAFERHGVTTLWLTAGLFQQMVEHSLEGLKGVRQLLTGGDVVSPVHAARFLRECGGRLVNGYGPTEATTFTTCHPITEAEVAAGSVPIGRPIANTRVYILDREMRPVPLGVRGELYIGGDGLARGYANSPALTAERFVPDPFSDEPGARLYQTGDVCRHLADGRVEFGGRRDGQVKLRGFRIELGEVEAAVAAHPAVREAAVVARAEPGGERFLVCYAVPRSPQATNAGELHGYLTGRLPEYMVPQRYVFLPELPLTANGKVDRNALPAPDDTSLARTGVYEEPQEGLETALAHIWGEVLKVERVGANDNFFELGGHSLLATQVVSRVRELLRVQLPLRALFEAPTISALASIISYIGSKQSKAKA